MKCSKCGHMLDFRADAWPIEDSNGTWHELWVCPECGQEDVV